MKKMKESPIFKCVIAILVLSLISCEGEEGESGMDGINGIDGTNGTNGLNSLLNISEETSGSNCENGGIRIDSGIDENNNGVLDSDEIQNSSFICNGTDGVSDEQVRFRFSFSANTTSTTPVVGGSLINFNKNAFVGVDSIVFAADPYVADINNTAFLELYNRTGEQSIENSLLSSSNLFAESQFLYSDNIFSDLPDDEITLGIRLWSGTQGQFAASNASAIFLLLYRSN